MHCYNCGKEITKKSEATSLDDLNWSHDACLFNPTEVITMFTEDQITKSKNDTPIGLASRCWGADINFNGYCALCNDIAISPVSQEAFEFIHEWWDDQLAKDTYLNN